MWGAIGLALGIVSSSLGRCFTQRPFGVVRRVVTVTGIVSLMVASTVSVGVSTAGAATVKKNAAAAALVPSQYKGKTLVIPMDASYPPDELVSATGQIVGFDVTLMNEIAATIGIKVKYVQVTFDDIIPGMLSKRYEVSPTSFTDTTAREKQVNFVDYYQAGQAFYEKASSKKSYPSLASTCGSTIAVETGTVEEYTADAQRSKCPSSKPLTVSTFSNQTDVNLAVTSGRAQLGFGDSQVMGYLVSTSKGAFKLVGNAIDFAPYGIAVAKSAGMGLAKAIQAAVKILITNGDYNAILKKWGATSGEIPTSKVLINGANTWS